MRRFMGPYFSLGWITFQSATSAWIIWKDVPVHHEAFWIWITVPICGLVSYIYGRLDQRNIDLRNEIQEMESHHPGIDPVAKLKYLIHFSIKEK